jgi:hypothetical protein
MASIRAGSLIFFLSWCSIPKSSTDARSIHSNKRGYFRVIHDYAASIESTVGNNRCQIRWGMITGIIKRKNAKRVVHDQVPNVAILQQLLVPYTSSMIEPRALEAALSAEGQKTPTRFLYLRIGVKYTASRVRSRLLRLDIPERWASTGLRKWREKKR